MATLPYDGRPVQSEFTGSRVYRTNKSGPMRWVISHVLRNWHYFFLSIVFQIVSSSIQASIPEIIGSVADLFLNGEMTVANLRNLSLTILIYGLVAGGLLLLRGVTIEVVSQRIERDTRDELYSSLIGKSLTFHDQQQIGDLMSRAAADVRQLNLMVNPGFMLVFAAAVNIVIPVIFIARINVQLLLVPFLFLIVFFSELKRYIQKLNPVSFRMRMEMAEMSNVLNESLTGIQLVRGSSQEALEKEKFLKHVELYEQYAVQSGIIQARYRPILWLGVATAFALFHGIFLVLNGTISGGQLVSFILLIQLFRFPTFINIFALLLFTLGRASAERILNLITSETFIDENRAGYSGTIQKNVRFENVTFGYHENLPVVEDITFEVNMGQTVALVGMTGSGKTTLTKLLARLYDPQKGSIYVDDVDLRSWSLESLRSQMAVVEQDIFLFSRTIMENITLGLQNVPMEKVIEAAKLAQAHDFIMKLPEGYDTKVGERGITLSGGQRQRVAIARAVLRDPRILILDDASSAIDSKTEDEIQRAINNVLKGRISFLITHRIAQIRKANLIILMDKGRIIAKGTHEELMGTSEKYRKLFSVFDEYEQETN